jgi:hypothetical protein
VSDARRCENHKSCDEGVLVQVMQMVWMQQTVDRRSSESDVGQIQVTARCERSYQSYHHLLDCYSLPIFHSPWLGVLVLVLAQVMEMELVLEEEIPIFALEQPQHFTML